MNDPLLWIGMICGMIYGMLFVLVSFVLFMRITRQLRQLLPQPVAKGETGHTAPRTSMPPVSLRRHSPIGQNPRIMTREEYISLINAKTQPMPKVDTDQLNP